GFRWRRGRDRGARRHLLDRGPLVGWDDDALGWRCSRRCTAWRGRRHHGFGRWSRGRALPFPGWWPFLLLLVLALFLLVGLGWSEHACAEALDRLGPRKPAGAGRKGEDTKESCQGGARHCWSRTSWRWWREHGASPGGASPPPCLASLGHKGGCRHEKAAPPRLFLSDLGQGVPRTRSTLYAGGRLAASALPPRWTPRTEIPDPSTASPEPQAQKRKPRNASPQPQATAARRQTLKAWSSHASLASAYACRRGLD